MSSRPSGSRPVARPRTKGTALSLPGGSPEPATGSVTEAPVAPVTATPRSKGTAFAIPTRSPEPQAEPVASSSQSQSRSQSQSQSQSSRRQGNATTVTRSRGTSFAVPTRSPEPPAEPVTATHSTPREHISKEHPQAESSDQGQPTRGPSATVPNGQRRVPPRPPSHSGAARITPGPSAQGTPASGPSAGVNGSRPSVPRAMSLLSSSRNTPSARGPAGSINKRPAPSMAPPQMNTFRAPSAGPSSSSAGRARAPARRLSVVSARSEAGRSRGTSTGATTTSSGLPRGPRGRPGRPPTAFALFKEEIRPAVADEAATVIGARFDITAEVKNRWNALSDEQRKPYEEDAARRKAVYESALEEWLKHNPEVEEQMEESRKKQKVASDGASDGAPDLSELPAAPVKPIDLYAYDVIAETPEASSTDILAQWKVLNSEDKTTYIQRGIAARQEYERAYVAWKEMHPEDAEKHEARQAKSKAKKRTKNTISDDEAEYLVEIMEHGRDLRSKRLDPSSVSMSEISDVKFKKGRASERTFHAARLFRNLRQQADARNRFHRKHGYAMPAEMQQAMQAPARRNERAREASTGATSTAASDGEDNRTSGGEETVGEGSDGDGSDTESVGATSNASTAVPFRERKFAIRTRIVNGQIVLDESSLQQNRNDEAAYSMAGEAIDVNESDRFVNSATHAKPRMRSERWTELESRRFLQAVSMWGSDFEMIARMFPRRDRKQVKARWRAMEKQDPRSLDLAFRRKLPVDLEAYGALAGVDLSGEAAPIEAKIIQKLEGDEEDEQEGEGSDAARIKKSPGPPTPAPEEEAEHTHDEEEDEQLPDLDTVMVESQNEGSLAAPEQQPQRAASVVSTGSQGPPQILAASPKGKQRTGRAVTAPRRGRSGAAIALPGEEVQPEATATSDAAVETAAPALEDEHPAQRELRPARASRRR